MEDSTPIFLTPTRLTFIPTRARRKRRFLLKRLREDIRRRDGGRCRYCGTLGSCLDHVFPHSKGGADTMENLVLACERCNTLVGARVFATFEAKRDWILAHRDLFDSDPQNALLAICTECFHGFRPRVGEASVFLCEGCMQLQDDERKNRRLREEGSVYVV